MKLSLLDPQLRSMYRFIPNPPVRSGLGRKIVRTAMNFMGTPKIPEGLRVEVISPGGDTPQLHLISPTSGHSGAALMYIHGGGMLIGGVKQDYPLAIRLARTYGITVALAGYRLAPEHPFPTPLDDCATAWSWLIDNAQHLGIDKERIAVGGQSAGGGLAAMLTQRLHDETRTPPVGQWLFCPMLDDRTAGDRNQDRVQHRLWNNRCNYAGWKGLLGVEPGADTVPAGAVPARRDDLSGLPPAWIGTGTVELFHAEDVDYARRLTAAGVDTTLDEVPGAPHAFESITRNTRLAKEYMARAESWLTDRLGIPTTGDRPHSG